jgi:hypothetical protein
VRAKDTVASQKSIDRIWIGENWFIVNAYTAARSQDPGIKIRSSGAVIRYSGVGSAPANGHSAATNASRINSHCADFHQAL